MSARPEFSRGTLLQPLLVRGAIRTLASKKQRGGGNCNMMADRQRNVRVSPFKELLVNQNPRSCARVLHESIAVARGFPEKPDPFEISKHLIFFDS